jgi:hypothetical protein
MGGGGDGGTRSPTTTQATTPTPTRWAGAADDDQDANTNGGAGSSDDDDNEMGDAAPSVRFFSMSQLQVNWLRGCGHVSSKSQEWGGCFVACLFVVLFCVVHLGMVDFRRFAKWKKVRKERKKELSGREKHVSCILCELSDSLFELSLNRLLMNNFNGHEAGRVFR